MPEFAFEEFHKRHKREYNRIYTKLHRWALFDAFVSGMCSLWDWRTIEKHKQRRERIFALAHKQFENSLNSITDEWVSETILHIIDDLKAKGDVKQLKNIKEHVDSLKILKNMYIPALLLYSVSPQKHNFCKPLMMYEYKHNMVEQNPTCLVRILSD